LIFLKGIYANKIKNQYGSSGAIKSKSKKSLTKPT